MRRWFRNHFLIYSKHCFQVIALEVRKRTSVKIPELTQTVNRSMATSARSTAVPMPALVPIITTLVHPALVSMVSASFKPVRFVVILSWLLNKHKPFCSQHIRLLVQNNTIHAYSSNITDQIDKFDFLPQTEAHSF